MTEPEFLSGRALSERIRRVCQEDRVDCAVAFWGSHVRDELFPRWEQQRVRIICDISMGCNSRTSLAALGAPDSTDLRVCDGLHAKVYVSAAGAVVCSANASANGIGRSGQESGNLEAGVFLPADSKGWTDAKAFFEALWKGPTQVIDEGQLSRAPERAADPGARISSRGPQDPSILALVRSYPERFADTLFFGEWEKLDTETVDRETRRYAKAESQQEFQPARRKLIVRSTHDYLPAILPNALMFWHSEHGKKIIGLAWSEVVPVRSRHYTTLWGVPHWGSYWRNHGGAKPDRRASDADRVIIKSENGGSWAKTATELAHMAAQT